MITWSLLHWVSVETGYTKYATVLIDMKRSRLRLWYLGDDAMRYISQSRGNRGERTSFSTRHQLHVQCHPRLSNRNSFQENTGKSTKKNQEFWTVKIGLLNRFWKLNPKLGNFNLIPFRNWLNWPQVDGLIEG